MKRDLIALLLFEEWKSRPTHPLYLTGGRYDYLLFLKSIASDNATDGHKAYKMAVRRIESEL